MQFLIILLLGAGVLLLAKALDPRLQITHYAPSFDNLPDDFDGFSIMQISDLHSKVHKGLLKKASDINPDIIVITGDLVNDADRHFQPLGLLLQGLAKVAPVYMVSGNHDLKNSCFGSLLLLAESSGVIFMDDSFCTIAKKDSEIGLFGIKDPFSKTSDKIISSLKDSLDSLPEYDGFRILLFHRANQFDRLKDKGFHLILSGHMHGGQVRIPFIGGVLPPKSSLLDSKQFFFPSYCSGLFKKGSTTMIVNRGLGNPIIIPRIFNRPEISVITLKSPRELND